VLAAGAVAAPRASRTSRLDPALSEHTRAAEQAWSAAEAERDPAKKAGLWEDAAGAFGLVDGDPVDANVKREAARAAVLAWKLARAASLRAPQVKLGADAPTPRELSPRDKQLVAAVDRLVGYVDAADPDLPEALYLEARTYAANEQLERAIPIFKTIVDRHRGHEVAPYAALLLFDAYNRTQQYEPMMALADALAKDAAFLRDRDDLAATVRAVQRASKRRAAEKLEREAHESHDPEIYVRAGQAYLDIYNADRENKENDETLYNAGHSFWYGHAATASIEAFKLLRRYYPNSKLAIRALAWLGKTYGDLALYDKAAEALEEYATRYAGEKDAYDALSDAVYYRKALGDRTKAIADTKMFIKLYGARKPVEAANASWSLSTLYEDSPAQLILHLREYLRVFGAKGGAERVAIAYARIGQLLLKQSCPAPLVDGLCVKANDRAPRTCGTGTTRQLTVIVRDKRKVAEAVASLASATKEYERKRLDDVAARYAYAQARLALADLELEGFIAIPFPRGLSFEPTDREASMKRFSEWISEKQKTGASVTRAYETVLTLKDAASAITAAERLAVVTQSFAAALATAELPRDVRTPDRIKAYCSPMVSVAEPLEARSDMAFGTCLAKSTELSWFGDSSAECERELIRLRPSEFPRMTELHGTPSLSELVVVPEPPPLWRLAGLQTP
jgi:tetratricopeptide (TPR) repeat protein